MLSASPAFVVRPVTTATAVPHARIPLVESYLEFADGERIRKDDAVLTFRSAVLRKAAGKRRVWGAPALLSLAITGTQWSGL